VKPDTSKLKLYDASGKSVIFQSDVPGEGGGGGTPSSPTHAGPERPIAVGCLVGSLLLAITAFSMHTFLAGFLCSLLLSLMTISAWILIHPARVEEEVPSPPMTIKPLPSAVRMTRQKEAESDARQGEDFLS